jgi:pimeloyl-ACP methyl ester carboxylesterase
MTSQHPLPSGLHVPARGTGDPVVALHGSASSGAQWRSLVGYLEGRFCVFTPDLPGYGGSWRTATTGLAGDARAIAALLDRIGRPVHLVGHSWGGAVALKIAAERPEAVRSLTVIEPAALHLLRAGGPADRRLHAEVMSLGTALDPNAGPERRIAAMRLVIDYWNGAGAWGRTSGGLQGFLLGCHDRIRAEFRALAREEGGVADLERITCPTLAVMGLESPVASLRVTEIVAGAVPRAVLRMVADAGHLLPLTDPHVVDPMIAAHILAASRVGGEAASFAA